MAPTTASIPVTIAALAVFMHGVGVAGMLQTSSIVHKRTPAARQVWTAEFTVQLDEQTTKEFVVEVHPEWAPLGAARFLQLLEQNVLGDARFFRVVPGFIVQFGMPGSPEVGAEWHDRNIPDDTVQQSNTRGYLTFATRGPNTRTTQMFINYGDNAFLDRRGFAPFAKVIQGMDVVDAIYAGYGEKPEQKLIEQEGNHYLSRDFPMLSYIKSVKINK